jgi:hypothetical protein
VEFRDLHAVMLGEEGRGIPTILEMGHLTRLECAIASAGVIRQASAQAINHAQTRSAFQRRLVDQPIMANVLADLAVEAEAHLWLAMRAAAALDDPAEKLLNRVITPVAKYWICKRAPMAVAEALECHGGNGFIEDHLMARLYREAPLNGVWEGAGNVICLDVIRALGKPEADCAGAGGGCRAGRGFGRAFGQARKARGVGGGGAADGGAACKCAVGQSFDPACAEFGKRGVLRDQAGRRIDGAGNAAQGVGLRGDN